MPQEAEEEDHEYGHGVIDPEVVEVALDADCGFADAVRAGEGREGLDELPPWAAARGGCGCGA